MELLLSECCQAPANLIMKGDVVSYSCPKCGKACKVKKASQPYIYKKPKRAR
jgi:predicted RNA-binding Zn-ribbon protein involved in translation (DUF1610 family)